MNYNMKIGMKPNAMPPQHAPFGPVGGPATSSQSNQKPSGGGGVGASGAGGGVLPNSRRSHQPNAQGMTYMSMPPTYFPFPSSTSNIPMKRNNNSSNMGSNSMNLNNTGGIIGGGNSINNNDINNNNVNGNTNSSTNSTNTSNDHRMGTSPVNSSSNNMNDNMTTSDDRMNNNNHHNNSNNMNNNNPTVRMANNGNENVIQSGIGSVSSFNDFYTDMLMHQQGPPMSSHHHVNPYYAPRPMMPYDMMSNNMHDDPTGLAYSHHNSSFDNLFALMGYSQWDPRMPANDWMSSTMSGNNAGLGLSGYGSYPHLNGMMGLEEGDGGDGASGNMLQGGNSTNGGGSNINNNNNNSSNTMNMNSDRNAYSSSILNAVVSGNNNNNNHEDSNKKIKLDPSLETKTTDNVDDENNSDIRQSNSGASGNIDKQQLQQSQYSTRGSDANPHHHAFDPSSIRAYHTGGNLSMTNGDESMGNSNVDGSSKVPMTDDAFRKGDGEDGPNDSTSGEGSVGCASRGTSSDQLIEKEGLTVTVEQDNSEMSSTDNRPNSLAESASDDRDRDTTPTGSSMPHALSTSAHDIMLKKRIMVTVSIIFQ